MIRQFFFVSVQVCGTRTRVSQLPSIFLLHQYVRNECTVCLLFYQGNSDKWDCRYSINRLLAIGRLCVSLYPIAIVR